MKAIKAWVTCDGKVHTDFEAAKSYADKRYGTLLSSLAHNAVRIGKYSPMIDWIEANAQAFRDLDMLLSDMTLAPSNEFEGDD